MGIPTLISTATETDVASIDITSGIDSTYDEYMFVCTDINPATNAQHLGFQVNVAGQSGYNETMTTTQHYSKHYEDDAETGLVYHADWDQAQGTALQTMAVGIGNGGDESCAGILHLFSPSNTTYVTHFYSTFNLYHSAPQSINMFTAGYVNATGAVDEIQFKMASGNFDGVIQMYGIS
tara:strand:+ start:12 stop:548 length:537 start_codon:yes stop_codon:yes gene_type:complete